MDTRTGSVCGLSRNFAWNTQDGDNAGISLSRVSGFDLVPPFHVHCDIYCVTVYLRKPALHQWSLLHHREERSKSATDDIVGLKAQWSSVLRIDLLDHLSSAAYATQSIGRLRRENSARYAPLKSLRDPCILFPQCGSYPRYAFSS